MQHNVTVCIVFFVVLEFLDLSDAPNTLQQGVDVVSRVPIDLGFPTFNAQDPQTVAYVSVCPHILPGTHLYLTVHA